ncbi:MAG: hypothetical protein K2M46_00455 [Lachnospiraceae bacterium]|nr:hypothetical protein [Lachnospiraceae bacterium]
MSLNCLTMLPTTVPTILMVTVLSALCSVFRYETGTGFLILQFPLDTACGRKRNQNWNWLLIWYARLCWSFPAKEMSSSSATDGMPRKILCMAGKGIIEPGRLWLDAVYSTFALWISVEYRSQLL